MKLRNLLVHAALAVLASASGTNALAQSDNLREIVINALAKAGVDKDNSDLVKKMLSVQVGPQFSASFDPLLAARAADPRTRLSADPECFRQRLPGNDPHAVNEKCLYRFGEPTGQDQTAVQLRFNRLAGKFSYLHRTRSFDANKMPDNTVKPEAAREAALELAKNFGIPVNELDRTYLQVVDLAVAAEPLPNPTGAAASERIVKRAEVQVRIPRRIGEWPVFDSGFMVAFGDAGAGRPRAARLNGRWPDFGLLLPAVQGDEVLGGDRLLQRILADLGPDIRSVLDPFRTQAFVAFVQASQVSECADGGDESQPVRGAASDVRPQDLMRRYVRAIVLFVVPPNPGEVKDPKLAPSTGVVQRAYSLIDVDGRLCDGSV